MSLTPIRRFLRLPTDTTGAAQAVQDRVPAPVRAPPDAEGSHDVSLHAASLRDRELDALICDFGRALNAEVAMCFSCTAGVVGDVVAMWTLDPASVHATLAEDRQLIAGLLTDRAAFATLDLRHDRVVPEPGRRVTCVVVAAVRTPEGVVGALCAGLADRGSGGPALALWLAEAYAGLTALYAHDPGLLGGLLTRTKRDGLTGCLDYASGRRALVEEVKRSSRHGLELSCAFIDLDGFKLVNDRHGHIYGNRVLVTVARELRAGVRAFDTVGRYGGDEFVVILPETAEHDAIKLAHRLRDRIRRATSSFAEPVEASIGVAQWIPDTSAEHLLEHADRALLEAKREGCGIAGARGGVSPADSADGAPR